MKMGRTSMDQNKSGILQVVYDRQFTQKDKKQQQKPHNTQLLLTGTGSQNKPVWKVAMCLIEKKTKTSKIRSE